MRSACSSGFIMQSRRPRRRGAPQQLARTHARHHSASGPALDASAPAFSRDLLLDNIRRSAATVSKASRRLLHPMALVHHLRQLWPPIREFLGEQRASRTSLNAPLSAARRIAVITSSLSTVKDASHRLGVTVNDAVLAAVAGGLRELLQSRGEMVDGLVLRAMVPVTLQKPSLGPLRGNLYGAMVVRLPVGEPDAVRRLHSIAAETASRKQRAQPPGASEYPARR